MTLFPPLDIYGFQKSRETLANTLYYLSIAITICSRKFSETSRIFPGFFQDFRTNMNFLLEFSRFSMILLKKDRFSRLPRPCLNPEYTEKKIVLKSLKLKKHPCLANKIFIISVVLIGQGAYFATYHCTPLKYISFPQPFLSIGPIILFLLLIRPFK